MFDVLFIALFDLILLILTTLATMEFIQTKKGSILSLTSLNVHFLTGGILLATLGAGFLTHRLGTPTETEWFIRDSLGLLLLENTTFIIKEIISRPFHIFLFLEPN